MGSPVSPIVANLCMEEIEELAPYQTHTSPPSKNGFALWVMFFQSSKNMRSPIFTTY